MNIYTLENDFLRIKLIDFGASWLSCQVKFANEEREVLVTTNVENWHKQTAYFGATIGRYANRIENGRYYLNGEMFNLTPNNGKHTLHGGVIGADKQVWAVDFFDTQAVRFAKIFADGEEGFGGEVTATVEYRLNGNQVEIEFNAVSQQDTPLCLTNHAYFNLSGEKTIHQHFLQLNANYFLPVTAEAIPTGQIKSVEKTSFDFRVGKLIGRDLLADHEQKQVKGYDHAFLLHSSKPSLGQIKSKKDFNLTACDPNAIVQAGNLRLSLYTTKPALQLYTGNWLGGQPDLQGNAYVDYAGIALEPEYLPDTPNRSQWWKFGGISRANEPYYALTYYKFDVVE
ncbi:galactose mutarotase [Vespertiliibacter pulmonis]|uniref:Aldose 1-epimerase n=1 Tax=Vespertiliibacter pulmonis TaxID=1443036 RepID=A0A3N4W4U4_9PAST|nr:galactose-1-epimerase [Vespertiliibacter pulmonis]QLB20224.1 galactose mutarotase [Vespertiliibacter pulmonis]RPE86201.1 aldose 1-epimerase [Vespertiliibacter pulmonis]